MSLLCAIPVPCKLHQIWGGGKANHGGALVPLVVGPLERNLETIFLLNLLLSARLLPRGKGGCVDLGNICVCRCVATPLSSCRCFLLFRSLQLVGHKDWKDFTTKCCCLEVLTSSSFCVCPESVSNLEQLCAESYEICHECERDRA